jgi:hypothetical protein
MDNNRRQSGRLQERQSRRAETELRWPLANRLAAYALAAGGAGLGMMATAQPAEARIVYTTAHEVFAFPYSVFLDVNNDGINDFRFSIYLFIGLFSARVGGAPGNGVRAIKSSTCRGRCVFASRVPQGAKISADEDFVRGSRIPMDNGYSSDGVSYGPWRGNASGFLGLEFQIDGRAHYGWAAVHMTSSISGVITAYAYNTVPNQPILAGQTSDEDLIGEIPPQPATLGLLALGAPALDIWRPRERRLAAE